MKKIFFAACMLTFAFMISAQGGQGGQGGGQRQGGGFQMSPERLAEQQEAIKKELNLNDKQFADYKKIAEETRTKTQAIRQNAGDDRDKMREESQKLTTEQNTKLKAVFTADQYKKYEAYLQNQRGQGGGQRQGGGGGGGNR